MWTINEVYVGEIRSKDREDGRRRYFRARARARDSGEYLIRGDLLIEQGVPGSRTNQMRGWWSISGAWPLNGGLVHIGLNLRAGIIHYNVFGKSAK